MWVKRQLGKEDSSSASKRTEHLRILFNREDYQSPHTKRSGNLVEGNLGERLRKRPRKKLQQKKTA